jgi:hypothetical protein
MTIKVCLIFKMMKNHKIYKINKTIFKNFNLFSNMKLVSKIIQTYQKSNNIIYKLICLIMDYNKQKLIKYKK